MNGAAALSSSGMPTVAERTAATTHPEETTGATEANDVSPHSGRADRHRAGPSRPSAQNPTPQPSALTVPYRCRRGAHDCTSSDDGGSRTSEDTDRGRPSQARWRHTPRRPRPAGSR